MLPVLLVSKHTGYGNTGVMGPGPGASRRPGTTKVIFAKPVAGER